MVRLLLELGANPLMPNAQGNTPCHLAAEAGHARVLAAMISCVEQALELVTRSGVIEFPWQVTAAAAATAVLGVVGRTAVAAAIVRRHNHAVPLLLQAARRLRLAGEAGGPSVDGEGAQAVQTSEANMGTSACSPPPPHPAGMCVDVPPAAPVPVAGSSPFANANATNAPAGNTLASTAPHIKPAPNPASPLLGAFGAALATEAGRALVEDIQKQVTS